MGDMADDFRFLRECRKKAREEEYNSCIDMIRKSGARELTMGVFRYKQWDLYPYKGMARNYKTKKYKSIEDVLREEA